MVISLESQNVKVKRAGNFEIRFPQLLKNIPRIKFSSRMIPFFVGLFIFSIFFGTGWNLFLPSHDTVFNLESVSFPVHGADVLSKNKISSYEEDIVDNFFTIKNIIPSETISNISIKYGISINTILQVNGINDIKKMRNLYKLKIPLTNGYLHTISSRDTLDKLSEQYNIPKNDIFRVNGLKSENINNLESIFIPYIDPEELGWKSNIDKFFIYPVNGYISKRYGPYTNSITGITTIYEGIDFTPIDDFSVSASRGGYISRIGYSANYGHYIYIDHNGGTRSLYAHLENISVSVRDSVKQGDLIGYVGKSGFTSEKKLFFSIFNNDDSVNPEEFLK